LSRNDIPAWALTATQSIMEMVKVKDEATYDHCIRVSRSSRLLAKAAGLSEMDQKIVEFSGLFHDVGKVGIPDGILLKPAKLTEEEFKIMQTHPHKSVQIIQPLADEVDFFRRIVPGVLHHHERFDGRGYPEGVMGEEIPLAARLILIADTFDAMTATRAYRAGLPKEVAYKELKDFAGRQFDPRLVAIFLRAQPTWSVRDMVVFEEMNHTVLKIAA
jgi:HD-GYP domain-containing protein (c-di-GMP phosphodiesterase class II)